MEIREIMKIIKVETIEIDNIEFLTVKSFCKLSNQTPQNLSRLCNKGNRYREKLKHIRIDTKILIPFQELFDYNFVDRSGRCYGFNHQGEKIKKSFPIGF